ncbi:MAG: KpsF/GutQ family sugar-phosphate isomerase [Candidatus Aureabacteria bacterium]|nr:KpsF/GutQ family sugar-phosphate isomerase [Candidatus Auribacterota bacterium]
MYEYIARNVFKIEANAISSLAKKIGKSFDDAVKMIALCKGRIILTGMGKTGIIAQKISATFSSIGIPSLYLNPAEAIHGDLGRVKRNDVILAISNSGETDELITMLPLIKKIGVKLITLTGNIRSTLARYSDAVCDVSVEKEACTLGVVPTSSTTAALAMGDALAVALIKKKKIKLKDFAFYHPGGALGKKLILKVEDIMRKEKSVAVVEEDCLVKDVLLKITSAKAGAACVVDKKGKLVGIFTDGDLRRSLDKNKNILEQKVKEVMTRNPFFITHHTLASEALRLIQQKQIDEIPVVNKKNEPIGVVDEKDLLLKGITY